MDVLERLPEIYREAEKEYKESLLRKGFSSKPFSLDENIIALGDNRKFLSALYSKNASFDFVYIDPPFFTDADYSARLVLCGEEVKTGVYGDKWDDIGHFLKMLLSRLFIIKDVLKDTGLVAVHLDTHASHYAKVLMDELFGAENFVNELVWSYKSGGVGKRCFARKHDTILIYSKTEDYYFRPQKEISYNRGGKPYKFKGVKEYEDEYGNWYTLVNRKDVINVDMVGRTSGERTGYATQKPERLLEILLKSCCPEGGLAGDFFAGSGTLAAVAAKLGRKYIICDASPVAYSLSCRRLKAAKSSFARVKERGRNVKKELQGLGLTEKQIAELTK